MAQSSIMGVIIQVFNPESGTSPKTGNQWIRQQIIVKKISNSQYEQFVALDINGQNNIQKINPQVGMVGEFYFDAESRYSQPDPSNEGRWFTSLSCYNFKAFQAQAQAANQQDQQGYQQGFQQQPAQNGGWNPQNGGGWNPNGGFGQ